MNISGGSRTQKRPLRGKANIKNNINISQQNMSLSAPLLNESDDLANILKHFENSSDDEIVE